MPTLKKENSIYVWYGPFETKDLPKQAGFRWNPKPIEHWTTTIPSIAAKLHQYADESCKAELESLVDTKTRTLEASRATTADIDLPRPKGLDYLPFQKAGIAFAMSRPNVLLGDEPGLGKTIQAIGIINTDESIRDVLVVCPASLKINWYRELTKWIVRPLTVGIANTWAGIPDTDVVIVNYDILKNFYKELMDVQWDLLIADEAHFMKNPKSVRTTALLGFDEKNIYNWQYEHYPGIADHARRKVYLTGSPLPNRPVELWPLIHSLDPNTFNNFMEFAHRYTQATEGRYGWDFKGSSNLEELQDKLRSTIMVRRLKKDVLKDLPPKTRKIVEIEPEGSAKKYLEQENLTTAKHEAEIRRVKKELERAKELLKATPNSINEEAYKSAVAKLRGAVGIAFTEMSRVRHETAKAKIPMVIRHLEECLESENKIVVFAHHQDVEDAIREAFPQESVMLRGGMSDQDKQASVDAFQNDPNIHIFIGSIKAAGVGLTLTAASHVVFAELDWVPGNVSQAEDRCHRIGQRDNVLVEHLVIDGSLDAKMSKTLVEKQSVIDKALDTPYGLELAKKSITPYEDIEESKDITPEDESTPNVTTITTPTLSDREVEDIHAKVKYLDSLNSDRANIINNAGYNKVDTNFGASLASQPKLSQKQALAAQKMLAKYKGQIESAFSNSPTNSSACIPKRNWIGLLNQRVTAVQTATNSSQTPIQFTIAKEELSNKDLPIPHDKSQIYNYIVVSHPEIDPSTAKSVASILYDLTD